MEPTTSSVATLSCRSLSPTLQLSHHLDVLLLLLGPSPSPTMSHTTS
jgi:hypothetical protein